MLTEKKKVVCVSPEAISRNSVTGTIRWTTKPCALLFKRLVALFLLGKTEVLLQEEIYSPYIHVSSSALCMPKQPKIYNQ
jgi:hypothetical protein